MFFVFLMYTELTPAPLQHNSLLWKQFAGSLSIPHSPILCLQPLYFLNEATEELKLQTPPSQ